MAQIIRNSDGSFALHKITGAHKGTVSAYYDKDGGLKDAEHKPGGFGGNSRSIKRGGPMWKALESHGRIHANTTAGNGVGAHPPAREPASKYEFSATDDFSAAHAEFAAETDTFSAKVSGNTAKLDHMYEGDGHRKLAEKAPKGSHLRDYHASMARYHFQKLSGGSVSHDKRNAAAALRAHKNSETATGERKADTFSAAHAEFAAVQGDHNVHLRPTKEIKAMSDAEFNKHHDYLEDINMHPHNVILTAKRYGNDKQVARAETLLRRHMKQGHLSSGIAKGRKMLSDSVKKTAGKPLGNHGFSATPDTFSAAHAEFSAVAAPKKAPSHDPAAVRELTLHADNTEKLYNNERYIHAAMMHKHDKGTYNHDLAAKAYKHHADAAAAHYTKEYGTKGPHGSFGVFSSADRAAAARHYADQNHPAQTTAVDDPRRDNRGPQHAVNAFKKKHPENFSATSDTFAAAHGEFAAMSCGEYASRYRSSPSPIADMTKHYPGSMNGKEKKNYMDSVNQNLGVKGPVWNERMAVRHVNLAHKKHANPSSVGTTSHDHGDAAFAHLLAAGHAIKASHKAVKNSYLLGWHDDMKSLLSHHPEAANKIGNPIKEWDNKLKSAVERAKKREIAKSVISSWPKDLSK